jgi:translation initiation factor IF-3
VNEIDVHNYWSEQNQTERDETSDKHEQAANYLEHGDDVKVMAQEKGLREVSNQSRRRRRHRNEVQEDVRTEDNENESEKNTRDDGGDFHSQMVTRLTGNSNLEILKARPQE